MTHDLILQIAHEVNPDKKRFRTYASIDSYGNNVVVIQTKIKNDAFSKAFRIRGSCMVKFTKERTRNLVTEMFDDFERTIKEHTEGLNNENSL